MTERCTIEHVWDELAKIFPEENMQSFRELCTTPAEGFNVTKTTFAADVAGLSTEIHDINRDRAKRRLILGHILLGIYDALRHGRKDFAPVPRVLGQAWQVQETALLLWSAQHGTSDDRIAAQ